jgi:hypothetical protein
MHKDDNNTQLMDLVKYICIHAIHDGYYMCIHAIHDSYYMCIQAIHDGYYMCML